MTSLSHASTCSVVIPSYKYGHLVGHAIESVVSQTKKPDRVFAVDDAGFDFYNLIERYPEVEFILRGKNMGIVDNFNDILFNRVDTDRVLFLGADNWLHPEAIERMSGAPEDIVSCDAYIVGEGKYRLWKLPWQPHGSALYDVKKAKEVGGYESSGREKTEEDSVLFKKMMDAGASFKRIEKALLYYRTHRMNFNG